MRGTRLALRGGALGIVLAAAVGIGSAQAATFSNGTNISIPAGAPATTAGAASPYPSAINVSGLSGRITDVNVTLNDLTHTFPDDVDVLLVGPGGQDVVLMSDDGGSSDVTNVDLIFDDAAAGSLPNSTQITSGTYKPTRGTTGIGEGNPAPSSFPSPAPSGPYGSALSVFNGTNPNGTWKLYVLDDSSGDAGSLGGWRLNIHTVGASVSPSSLTFPTTQVGGQSAPENVTVTSTGTDPLFVSGVSTSNSQFSIDGNTCGTSALSTGQSCTIPVVSTPQNTGATSGTLTISDNAADSPQTVDLNGFGCRASCFEGRNARATAGTSSRITTAVLTDPSVQQPTGTTLNTLAARIRWGDGTSSAAQVIVTGPGQISVIGTHTYAAPGTYDVVTVINPGQPGSQTVHSQVTVS